MSIIDKLSATSCDVSENFIMSFVYSFLRAHIHRVQERNQRREKYCRDFLHSFAGIYKFINWKSFRLIDGFTFGEERKREKRVACHRN
jgi:hypothetical protein